MLWLNREGMRRLGQNGGSTLWNWIGPLYLFSQLYLCSCFSGDIPGILRNANFPSTEAGSTAFILYICGGVSCHILYKAYAVYTTRKVQMLIRGEHTL